MRRRRAGRRPRSGGASGPGSPSTRCSSGAPATAGASRSDERSRRRPARAGARGRATRQRPRCSRSRRPSSTRRFARRSPTRRVSPEVPFVLSVGGTLIRGSIDLLARAPRRLGAGGRLQDRPSRRAAIRSEIVARYSIQRDLYALAAAARGAPVETAYVFLERPDEPVRESFGEARARGGAGRVEAVLERLAAGRFEVTDRPHRALCADCPARERLCSHDRGADARRPRSADRAGPRRRCGPDRRAPAHPAGGRMSGSGSSATARWCSPRAPR